MSGDWDELQKVAADSIAANKNVSPPPPELERFRQDYLTILDQFRKDAELVVKET